MKDAFFSSLCFYGFFIKKHMSICVALFLHFDSMLFINMSVFMPIPCRFFLTIPFFKFIWDKGIVRSSFIVQDYFRYFCFLFIHMIVSFVLSRYAKNYVGYLMGMSRMCRFLLLGLQL